MKNCIAKTCLSHSLKLTVLILILLNFKISFSQTSILDKEISITFKQESLETALSKIETIAGYSISYAPDAIKGNISISKVYSNTSLREILNEILVEYKIYYRAVGNTILIQTNAKKGEVSGQIMTSDGNPAPFVSVMLQNTSFGESTDKNGFFSFYAPEGEYFIVTSAIGLKRQIQPATIVSDTNTQINFVLGESTEALQEVIVNGKNSPYVAPRKPSKTLRLQTERTKLPQNIQIISKGLLNSQNLINMRDDVIRNVSGVVVGSAWLHDVSLYMRGFQLPAFRNGMYTEMTYGPLPADMAEIETIEFVKGPSSFMLSSGEPGGFYNIVTKKPTPYKRNEIAVTIGSFNSYRAALSSGGALTKDKKLQYHLTGFYNYNESHKKYDEREVLGIIPSLKYEFSNKTSILTELTYKRAKMRTGIENVILPRNINGNLEILPRDFTIMEENWPKSEIKEVSLFTKFTHKFSKNWSVDTQYMYMKYGLDGYYTYVKDGVQDNGDMFRTLSTWDGLTTNQLGQVYFNGKFKTGFITHKIMGGMDYRHTKSYNDFGRRFRPNIDKNAPFNIYNPVYGNAIIPEFEHWSDNELKLYAPVVGAKNISFYLQDEMWMLNDKLRLTIAGRHTNIDVEAYGSIATERKYTPRIGVSYDILPNLTLYGLFDQSFTPNFGRNVENTPFDPVNAKDIEAGIKSSWIDGRLRMSVTAYQITKENVLVPHPDGALASQGINVQVGEVQSKGVEFDAKGQITPELNVILNYAFTEPKVTEDTNINRLGQPLEGHAKHLTNAWLNYNFKESSALKGFGASIGYRYAQDNIQWDAKDNVPFLLPDYFRLDGALNWQNDKFNVSLNVYNILDEYLLYTGGGYYNTYFSSSEPGINGRLTVRYKF
ncbi:TonB-dependent siderophore receptor [Aquimarina sediminis]|uniref:TonB-dependent siderophore receptor n=1 Tax=Aquimarina sediminis TaxID=2070536 RepID=UPI000CA033B0|nr:TonB-dependent siderophore receptor [Aquimarina sediminis]